MVQTTVSFNLAKDKAAYDDLVEKGLVTQSFPDFVRAAYHEKVGEINLRLRGAD